jgi:hypothetical protein
MKIPPSQNEQGDMKSPRIGELLRSEKSDRGGFHRICLMAYSNS